MLIATPKQPSQLADLVAVLRWRGEHESARRAFTYVNDDSMSEAGQLSFGELDMRARAIGVLLAERGAAGKPVLLVFPSGFDFVPAFWGCLYAGAIAVPLAMPERGHEGVLRRIEGVTDDAKPHCLLTTADADALLAQAFADSPALRDLPRVAVDRIDDMPALAQRWQAPALNAESLACLQYTSGSTGTAKGVMLSHGNFLANSKRAAQGTQFTNDSVLVTWSPTSHAAGLMYGVCIPVCEGFHCVHLETRLFLEQPVRWLRAISHFRATHSGGPNFAYDQCAQRIKPEQWHELRLDSWKHAYSSGEAVRVRTLRRFARAAQASGFSADAFQASYGISEVTMRVAESPAGRFPSMYRFDVKALGQSRAVEVSGERTDDVGTEVLGYGPLERAGRKIRVVDPETMRPVEDGRVGEIWISGADVAQGYLNRPEDSEAIFRATLDDDAHSYFRSGDLGVVYRNELFLVGRLKELIIIRGANHFPQDIELDVEQAASQVGIQRAAAFSHRIVGEEVLVLAVEVDALSFRNPDDVAATIREVVSRKHGLRVYDILFVPSDSLPRTGTGKLQRRLCHERYESGELEVLVRTKRGAPRSTQQTSRAQSDIRTYIRRALAERVDLSEDEIGDRPFAEYGLDSLGLVSLASELGEYLARPVSPAELYDHPTVDALVRYLTEGETGSGAQHQANRAGIPGGPIAIVGMYLRFPGGDGLDDYWRLLTEGIDAVSEVPSSRWDAEALYDPEPGVPGKTNSRWGGFIEGVDLFDRELFGLSERAARDTDPQHRLLLEAAWATFEDAGIAPESLAGTATGVFVGISQSDYGRITLARTHDSSPFVATGTSPAVASGRLSYTFDLHGPSVSVDTACSSSLVAIHQACRAIRNGECDLALAAAVNLILTPERTISLSHGTFFAADGKCKPFDASANGYVRGEGVGALLLKPLDRAIEDQDRIYAVIRGSAVNQDGKTNGLTAPNGLAQREVVRAALRDAGLRPRDVDYVEAHGTGTALGDPIEVEALGAVFSSDGPREAPVAIGSVKSNIGHLESAAGMAGVVKAALTLHRRTLVPTLHLKQLNPHIRFAELPIIVQQRTEPWDAGFPRVAGISSFGYSGTNAHVVLEEAPVRDDGDAPAHDDADANGAFARSRQLLVLSGASEAAVRDQARRFGSYVAQTNAEQWVDACYTAALTRAQLPYRVAVAAASPDAMAEALRAFADTGAASGVVSGRVPAGATPKIGFLFTGSGAQYIGMGRELYETEPVFRSVIDRCSRLLEGALEFPLKAVMLGEVDDKSLIDQLSYLQPALFAFEYAMTELWRSWGIEPDLVIGHSLGELIAACVAGMFDLEDGLRLIATRGRLMQSVPRQGEMLAIVADEERAQQAVRDYPDELAVAAINGPESIVISGTSERIGELQHRLAAEGVKCTRLAVSGAPHSALMDPILDDFEAVAARVTFRPPRLAVISNVTGTIASADEVCSAAYWRRHIRQTVRFAQGVETLAASQCNIVIEVGPRPTLLGMAREIVGVPQGVWLPSIHKSRGNWEQLLESLGAVYVHGGPVDWRAVYRGGDHRRMALPTYPFQRRRYWVHDDGHRATGSSPPQGMNTGHPLLGHALGVLGGFEQRLAALPSFIGDHFVFGRVVFPGAAFVESALATARTHWGAGPYELRDMSLMAALVVENSDARHLHIHALPDGDDLLQLRIFSGVRGSVDAVPVEHARLELRHAGGAAPTVDWRALRARCEHTVVPAEQYAMVHKLGLQIGPAFQGLREILRGTEEAVAEIELDDARSGELGQYLIHPAMLDCGFQLSGVAQGEMHTLSVPVGFERITFYGSPARRVFCHARITDQQGPQIKSDVQFFDADGRVLVKIEGYAKRAVRAETLIGASTNWARWVSVPQWKPVAAVRVAQRAASTSARHWLILANSVLSQVLAQRLASHGDLCTIVSLGDHYANLSEGRFVSTGSCERELGQIVRQAAQRRPVTDVVDGWSIDDEGASQKNPGGTFASTSHRALHIVQGLLSYVNESGANVRLTFVTRGAQRVEGASDALRLDQAPLWGFGRVVRREHPELGARLVDLDSQGSLQAQAAWLASELVEASTMSDDKRADEVVVRAGTRHEPQLARLQLPSKASDNRIRSDATYLVTGGLSGLGLIAARRLVERGARSLVLVGRRGATEESESVLRWMAQQGARVIVERADVGKTQDIARVLSAARLSMPALRGVIHCAGVVADRSIERQTSDSFDEVFGPKVEGAWHLHIETQADPLDFFVLYSSNSSVVGLGGQANYAAANAFLDALAHHRKAMGLPALAINWGPWADVGMAVRSNVVKERLSIDPARGLEVLDGLIDAAGEPAQAVVPATTDERPGTKAAAPAWNLLSRLSGLAPDVRIQALRDFIRECVAAVSGRALEDIPFDQPVVDIGLDSLMTVELRLKLGASLGGKRLSNTFTLKHPTVAAMADELLRELGDALASASSGDTSAAFTAAASDARGSRQANETSSASSASSDTAAIATNVVLLPGNASKVPLTMVHGMGGYAWSYLPLRQYTGDRPLVLVNKVQGGETLAEYVALLVETLRSQQPHGPYILGGWSAGGRLAFEVASLLERQGERVLGVLMFDVYRQTGVRLAKFVEARRVMDADAHDRALAGMHAIERLVTIFGTGIRLADAQDVAHLAQLVLPDVSVPAHIVSAGMAHTARWFLDQLAENGRGLMLPDPSGEVTEALETLFTIRRFYRMTMGEIDGSVTLAAQAFSINVTDNEYSRGWERHFVPALRQLDVRIASPGHVELSPFSCFAEHIALFDKENVATFGPQVADFLSEIERTARSEAAEHLGAVDMNRNHEVQDV
ncbi:type I polyketide synthase [Trinickia acidisoli]|uniref:type I polyketide synthase n=1 Tax=Trinickia acidisoli TaxID=2767482 RepID=UPI001A8CE374|nr:type I polyketide synthase [Trinickia acidisoli]